MPDLSVPRSTVAADGCCCCAPAVRNSSLITLGPNGQACSVRAQMRNAMTLAAVQMSMIRMAAHPEAWKM